MKRLQKIVVLAFITAAVATILCPGKPAEEPPSQTIKIQPKVDERIIKLETYLNDRDMPLAVCAPEFIKAADDNKLDWRLLPAISIQESSGGKHYLNNNPFGWASCRIKFASITDAITEVASNLGGNDPATENYYKNKTLTGKLHSYNCHKNYAKSVLEIMEKINSKK